jgi:hypothetical protein
MNSKVKGSTGRQGIPTGVPSLGFAYVTIPQDIPRADYIRNVQLNNRVQLKSEDGFFTRDAIVTDQQLNEINFPLYPFEPGTPVIWGRLPKNNQYFIILILTPFDKIGGHSEEGQFRIHRSDVDGTIVDIDGKLSDGSFSVSIVSKDPEKGNIRFQIRNPEDAGSLSAYIRGKIDLVSTKEFLITSHSEFYAKVLDPETGEEKGRFSYILGEGLTISDEFLNSVTTNSEQITIVGNVKALVEAPQVYLGSDQNAQPIAKGNDLNDNLGRVYDALDLIAQYLVQYATSQASVASATGVLTPLAAPLGVLNGQIVALQTTLGVNRGLLPTHLSTIVFTG